MKIDELLRKDIKKNSLDTFVGTSRKDHKELDYSECPNPFMS